MSQRNRAHTTDDAAKAPKSAAKKPVKDKKDKTVRIGASSQPDQSGQSLAQEQAVLSPETLARTLRAVAAELERDPELARRISGAITLPETPEATASTTISSDEPEMEPTLPKSSQHSSATFRPRLITGTSPDLGAGIPDPFTLYAQRGEQGLRAALEELRLGTLRAIIREHHLDPQSKVSRQNDAGKLRALIMAAVGPHS